MYQGHNFIICGNALDKLQYLESESVDCILTSPPYYGLRDYGKLNQIGLEESPELYIDNLVQVFRELWRVLKPEGTAWLNIGDSYWANRSQNGAAHLNGNLSKDYQLRAGGNKHEFYKPKDLMMIPARVALALQADGWYLRSQIIWHKPNAMPESVSDRPTNDYEMVYLLSKSESYFYNADEIRESNKTEHNVRTRDNESWANNANKTPLGKGERDWNNPKGRNKRATWSINTRPYDSAHFATMPKALADTCIKAGCPANGIVLDPFGGAGTTALSAISLQRRYILIELNPSYISLAQKRLKNVQVSLFD